MYKDDRLARLGAISEWIWGDDNESVVFAQVYGHGHSLIFRFTADEERPYGLATRIVNCYHDIDVTDQDATFADRPSMGMAVGLEELVAFWNTVKQVGQVGADKD